MHPIEHQGVWRVVEPGAWFKVGAELCAVCEADALGEQRIRSAVERGDAEGKQDGRRKSANTTTLVFNTPTATGVSFTLN